MYVLFFSQSQFQMLPDIFSANHIVGLHLIVPFIQSPCKSLCEIVGSNSLQMFVYLFLLGFLRTLLPFWYAWVINCSIVLYFRYFRIFSIPWKNLCVHEHVKKPLHFWGFCFLFFSFYNHCIYTGDIFVPFYFRPFHSFPPRCHAAGKFNYLRAVSSDPTGTFTKTHQEF